MAPAARARGSFDSETSTAMIRPAPASRAPGDRREADAAESDDEHRRHQAARGRRSERRRRRSGSRSRAGPPPRAVRRRGAATTALAGHDDLLGHRARDRGTPRTACRRRACRPECRCCPRSSSTATARPCVQCQQVSHGTAQLRTTWRRTSTPAHRPASVTTPEASCPSTSGYDGRSVPLTIDRSEWQTPTPAIRTRTSSSPRARSVTSWTSSSPGPDATRARVTWLPRGFPGRSPGASSQSSRPGTRPRGRSRERGRDGGGCGRRGSSCTPRCTR